jgi:3-phenylpropionate/trans-cinnamate dioxygenase ferredoxin reductase subunit
MGRKATRLDRQSRVVELADGTRITFEKLLLGTGARPKRPVIPGIELPGVHVLRQMDDSLAIRDAIGSARQAVMLGTGYIGMEVGSACFARGVKTTLVDPGEHPWGKFASPTTGHFLRTQFEKRGATFMMGDQVVAFEGDGKLQRVRTKAGQVVDADLAVVGVGVTLNVDLAGAAGLELDEKHGVVVDKYLRTADPDVFAAGDIAAFDDIALEKRWHAEHYLNGKWQGKQAGRNMAGANEPFDKIPYFFSDMADLHMILRGDPQGGKPAKVLGDVDGGTYVELYAREDGTLAMGLAFGAEEPWLDAVSDRLEEAIRLRAPFASLTEASFALPGTKAE